MTRQQFMLAVLAAGNGEAHNSVQVQKLFFLIDRKVPARVGGPWFDFQPDAYGPFDKAVATELRALEGQGLVAVSRERPPSRTYRLTAEGLAEGQKHLAELPPETAEYIRRLSEWVRRLSFFALVTSIYREFPEMRVNAVFQEGQ
jgi:hypothetical protein